VPARQDKCLPVKALVLPHLGQLSLAALPSTTNSSPAAALGQSLRAAHFSMPKPWVAAVAAVAGAAAPLGQFEAVAAVAQLARLHIGKVTYQNLALLNLLSLELAALAGLGEQ
jgi:hypothetical protein